LTKRLLTKAARKAGKRDGSIHAKWLVPLLAVLLLIGVCDRVRAFSRRWKLAQGRNYPADGSRVRKNCGGGQLVDPIVEAEEETAEQSRRGFTLFDI
jgi:hypothetical protein